MVDLLNQLLVFFADIFNSALPDVVMIVLVDLGAFIGWNENEYLGLLLVLE